MSMFDRFKDKCKNIAGVNTTGVPEPTESVPPSEADTKANTVLVVAWETAKQAALDADKTEEEAIAIAGPKPPDLSDNTKWPTRSKKHEAVAAFVDNGLWADNKTSLYILSQATAELIDESKYNDAAVRAKINEMVDAINLLMFTIAPPLITVPQTTKITTPITKLP